MLQSPEEVGGRRTLNMVPRRPRVKHCPHKMIPNSGRIPACRCPKPELPCLPAPGFPFLLPSESCLAHSYSSS